MKPTVDQLTYRSWAKLPWVLKLLLLYLAAITIFGKGPTYIGFGPVYWGEIVLLFSLLWALRRWPAIKAGSNRIRVLTLLVCLFLMMGAIETLPNYQVWGIDALRDFAVCYYALFYFVGVAIASDSQQYSRFFSWWKLFWIISIPWGIIDFFTASRLAALSPDIRGRGPLLGSSGSELAQSVALGCLLLLSDSRRTGIFRPVPRLIVATLGLAATAGFHGRGARLAGLAAFAIMIGVSITQQWFGRNLGRRVSVVLLLLICALGGALAAGVDLGDSLSLDRFRGLSLDDPEAGENVAFRTDWWSALYSQVLQQNPVFGLGFGENLADYSPTLSDQSNLDNPVRSPHNYNVTVFSRMGISGVIVWVVILFLGILIPLWNTIRASTPADRADAKQRWFLVAALVAMWINSSFAVLMEGPAEGIPFWLLLGLLAGIRNTPRNYFPMKPEPPQIRKMGTIPVMTSPRPYPSPTGIEVPVRGYSGSAPRQIKPAGV